MIDIVLVSHGSLAGGIREAAEMILGEQEHMIVLGLYPGDTVDSFAEKLEKAIDCFEQPSNVLVLSDIPSGTPSNTVNRMVLKKGVRYLTGYNLPMVLEVLASRQHETMDELVKQALEAARNGLVDSNQLLGRIAPVAD